MIAANGPSTTRYSYGPYGEPDAWTGSRFRYTGQAALPEVRLYHYKARVYDPVLGRFLQTDPIGYEDDMNLYAYVHNDPLMAVDPTGQCQEVRGDDGSVTYIGICSDDEAADIIAPMMNDPATGFAEVEAEAVAAKVLVLVRIGERDATGGEVFGGRTQLNEMADGTHRVDVTLDQTDTVVGNGVDAASGEAVSGYVFSDQETLVHEIGGHARAYVAGATRPQGETGAIGAENRFREAHGNNYRRREGDRVWTRPRR